MACDRCGRRSPRGFTLCYDCTLDGIVDGIIIARLSGSFASREDREDWLINMTTEERDREIIEALRSRLSSMNGRDLRFAEDLVSRYVRTGTLTDSQWYYVVYLCMGGGHDIPAMMADFLGYRVLHALG